MPILDLGFAIPLGIKFTRFGELFDGQLLVMAMGLEADTLLMLRSVKDPAGTCPPVRQDHVEVAQLLPCHRFLGFACQSLDTVLGCLDGFVIILQSHIAEH